MGGKPFTVAEFLTEVRRIVTDFALGQILGGASTEALDEWTRYYLMHRNHFGTEDAPVGECILLAQGYGVLLDALTANRIGILKKASSGSKLRLLGHTDRNSGSGGATALLWRPSDDRHGSQSPEALGGGRQCTAQRLPRRAPGSERTPSLRRSSKPSLKRVHQAPRRDPFWRPSSITNQVHRGAASESSASGGGAEQQLTIKGVLS